MAIAAETDALPRTDRRTASLARRDQGASEAARDEGPFSFILEVALPFFGKTLRSVALGALVALGGCGGEPIEIEGVVRDGRTGAPIAGAHITPDAGRTVETDEDGRFSVAAIEGERIAASAEGRCDADARVEHTPRLTLNLFDRLEVEEPEPQVGFDREVRVVVRTRCDEEAPITWRQIAGPELGSERMRVEENGRVLVVRTHALSSLIAPEDRPHVIALDRHQRGDYRFELEAELGGSTTRRVARVLAAPTSAGLYQAPTGADMYVDSGRDGENEWRLVDRPRESHAELADANARVARLRPDRFGTYLLEHRPSGVQMSIQAGPYEDVPRDCGRDGCHSREDEGWAHTAHASTFRRGLEGELGPDFDERCWSCHATGVDPGVDNGGLHHTAASVGWQQPAPDAGLFDQAPRRVRRNGSVWCSACHGPGRIVPPQFRWQYGAKFQVGVCARCHDVDEGDPDANHVSPEVDEWRLAAMSSFVRDLREDDPALRRECARCHSAQGFVAWRRGREELPDRDTVEPIACAACHDAHDASNPSALRVFDTVEIAGAPAEHLGAGALCASCHGADGSDLDSAPHAPQADVLVGRGARLVPALDGGAHRFIANTCVRCHMTRPGEGDPLRGLAGGHTFSIRARSGEPRFSAAACAPCHGDEVAPEAIGARDWDGDGASGSVREEHERAIATLGDRLRARIASLAIHDRCGRTAADVSAIEARLHLVDAMGAPLGDCDGDGRIGEGEAAVTISALPRRVADAAHDLTMLARDGSAGIHNPAYAFGVLRAVGDALR